MVNFCNNIQFALKLKYLELAVVKCFNISQLDPPYYVQQFPISFFPKQILGIHSSKALMFNARGAHSWDRHDRDVPSSDPSFWQLIALFGPPSFG